MSADRIAPRLYMGSAPDPTKAHSEFDVIVLSASEYQPHRFPKFKGTVIRAPFDDTLRVSADERRVAIRAAREVAKRLKKGQRVLVTCQMGLNCSGLVAGLALKMASRLSNDEIIGRIRAARGEWALSNYSFERFLRGFGARKASSKQTSRRP